MVTGAAPGPRCRERDRERAPAPAPVPAAGRKAAAAAAAAVAGLCALCYGNALPGEFVHDDVWAIVNNPDVRAAAPVAAAFANDFWGKRMAENTSHKSYRPLCVLTFKLSFGPAFFPTGVSLSMLFRVHENKVLWLLLVS